jgi:putative MATE family efflux protein
MKDLTQGPIGRQLAGLAVPIAFGMLLQTLYYLVDLYFVARLGDAAMAGVSAAGNVMFVIFALTQMLSVGTVTLISHAVGRKDRADANHIFNQSVALSALCSAATMVGGYAFSPAYMRFLGADAATAAAGTEYLFWFLPGLALQFAMVALGAALRGTGIVKPTMAVQMITVLANTILAPILIAGWITGHPMGVAGAGLASTLAITAGVAFLAVYYVRLEKYVAFDPAHWRPQLATWGRMLNIGLPAGAEFALLGFYIGVVYWIIRDFGAAAQAGFGIGSRLTQSIFLPAMAIAFAASPLAGQNFGAHRFDRVRETFRVAAWATGIVMFLLTLLCQWRSDLLLHAFTRDAAVVAFATDYLQIISWNFIAVGLVFTAGSLFQALGNTWPSLAASALRLFIFALPAIWLSRQAGFRVVDVWHLSVATVFLQAALAMWLLRGQFRKRLGTAASVAPGDASERVEA